VVNGGVKIVASLLRIISTSVGNVSHSISSVVIHLLNQEPGISSLTELRRILADTTDLPIDVPLGLFQILDFRVFRLEAGSSNVLDSVTAVEVELLRNIDDLDTLVLGCNARGG
jgi:hypothetical protein